jgi:hypothetical protein
MSSPNSDLWSGQSPSTVEPGSLLRPSERRYDRVFFSGMAVVILAAVFVGFARSYFLAGVFKARLPSPLIHLHGAAFSCWILLLIAQTSLVAAGKVAWHRRLGVLGFGLACAMLILGVLASLQVLARPPALGESPRGPRAFFAVPLSDMLVFSTLVYFGFRERKNPVAHKRLLLIATIALLDAAFVRWPVSSEWWTLKVAQTCCYPLLLLIVAYDLWSARKIYRATIVASALLIFTQQVRAPIGRSRSWQNFAASVQQRARSWR